MLISRQTWWVATVITLFLAQCACVWSSDEAQRLIKDTFWVPGEEEDIGPARWEEMSPDEEIIQSDGPIYGADLTKSTNDNEVLVDSDPDTEVQERAMGGFDGLRAAYYMRNRNRPRQRPTASWVPSATKRRHGPRMGFMGSRGKRFIPGLESLLLAKYYRDAEKWKRQPHSGFHGSRG